LLKKLAFVNGNFYLYCFKTDMEIVTDNQTNALTRFTALQDKIGTLLSLKKITPKDIEDMNNLERECLGETITARLAGLKGVERDSFLDKIELIVPPGTKNSFWEYNHLLITNAISNFMREHGIMPTKKNIAEETGLSRQTVAKHIKDYRSHPEFTAETEQFKFMAHQVLATVFKSASKGDTKAARLYFEMVGEINKLQTNTIVNKQNNYIQINNTILNQETLKQLSAEQLNQIENIITNKELMKIS
jgi:predicted transcriptional regulator